MHDGVRVAHSDPTVRSREISTFLIALVLLLWPLAVNGAPFYSPDSASYLRGGAFGFDTGFLFLQNWWQSLVITPPSVTGRADLKAAVAGAVAEAGGIRSVIYSMVTYLLRGPGNSLLTLAIAQAGAVVFVTSYLRRLIAPHLGPRPGLVLAAGLAFLTSAPWYAAYAVPDILAGITIAGALALTVFFDRIGIAMRVTLIALIAFCITSHGGNLPIALSVLVAGAGANFTLQRPPLGLAVRQALWFVSPLVLAVAALLGTSYVAFGEASLAPSAIPSSSRVLSRTGLVLGTCATIAPPNATRSARYSDRTRLDTSGISFGPKWSSLSRDSRADGKDPCGGKHDRPPRSDGISAPPAQPVRDQHRLAVRRLRN